LDVLAVLHDAWNSGITIRVFEHFLSILAIRLGVAIDERNAL
jgi:hypothetical protein